MRKYLVGKEKGCNFALAFEKQRHGGAENKKVQAKALNFVKTTEKNLVSSKNGGNFAELFRKKRARTLKFLQ